MAKSIKRFLKSFTLIELIIVIAIIAVLGATAFLVLSQWMSKSRDSRKIADLGTIDTAINISITSNDKLPSPDNLTKVMFSGNRIWDVGYFGDEAVKQIGGSITKTPIDPTTKERYRYAQWANKKYQLGTIIENQQFSKYLSRTYAQSYFTRLQGNYNQSIIVAKIDNVDTILPVPSLIVDKYEGEEKILDEEHFWTNKSIYNLGGNQSTKLKVQSLFSGDISKLSVTTSDEFTKFINNFEKVYTGTNFVSILNNQSDDEIKVAVAQELSKVSSQPVSVLFLTCEGYNHGAKVDFYKLETVGYGENCDSIKSQFECNNGNWIGENKTEYTKTSCNVTLPAQCDGNDHGTVKDFYSVDSVVFGQTCSANLKSFTCDNGVWKDGTNNADTTTYQYSSCAVGNPVDCNATSIVKKSVNDLDIAFDIPASQHGLSFNLDKSVNEANGIYNYSLVGTCNNGTLENIALGTPIFQNCNVGYKINNNICVEDTFWGGDATNGFLFTKLSQSTYPKSCNDLLVSTVPNFKYGTTSPYNGTNFVSGVYWLKPNADSPIKAYCDMTSSGGGWTFVGKSVGTTTSDFITDSALGDFSKVGSTSTVRMSTTNINSLLFSGNRLLKVVNNNDGLKWLFEYSAGQVLSFTTYKSYTVRLTEPIYGRISPFYTSHPHFIAFVGISSDTPSACAATYERMSYGTYINSLGRFMSYCQDLTNDWKPYIRRRSGDNTTQFTKYSLYVK